MRHTRTDTEQSNGPVLTCTRRDSPFHRFLSVNAQRVSHIPCALDGKNRLDRIITENRPCRFYAITVTLATRTCVRLRARWVGGLSSAAIMATVGRSLPLLYLFEVSGDKDSARDRIFGYKMAYQAHEK